MDASLIWENPGLTMLGIVAGIFLLLSPLIISAARRSRERDDDVVLRNREPSIHDHRFDDRYADEPSDFGGYGGDYDDEISNDRWNPRSRDDDKRASQLERGSSRRKAAPELASSSRSPRPARFIWFLLGIGFGAGGMALWLNPPSGIVEPVLALLERPDPPPLPAAEGIPEQQGSKAEDRFSEANPGGFARPAAIGDGDTTEVIEMVERFVLGLRQQLPMSVGPGITMVNVDSEGNVVALGFAIAQTVAEEDAPKLQEELEMRFRQSVCATAPDSDNIHGLNERGVSFIITYVDLIGNKVAALTVEPRFCSNPS